MYYVPIFLFLVVIDWVMKKTTEDSGKGIIWGLTKRLEDIDFYIDKDVRKEIIARIGITAAAFRSLEKIW
uniref:ABC transmembrane type-1 domain-containing protein n=1 Tax=Arion vulgaris TaxID=1028688 RepID=A0A0B7AAU1_9EUPU